MSQFGSEGNLTTAIERIEAFQRLLHEAAVDAALLHSPHDIFYFTGTKQPANLVIPSRAGSEPRLFVRRARDFVEAEIGDLGFPVAWLADGPSFHEVATWLRQLGYERGRLGTAEDRLSVSMFRALGRALPTWETCDVAKLILGQRMVKDEREIALMRQACALYGAAHEAILATARPGVSELEVSIAIFASLRRAGQEEFIPMRRPDALLPASGIFVSGENLWRISGHAYTVTGVGISASTRLGASRRRIQAGDLLVCDIATQLRGYHGDTARTYVVGEPSSAQRLMYDACRQVYAATIAAARPGITAAELYDTARAAAAATGYAEYFMGYPGKQGAYIGHATGVEQDEPPVLGPRVPTTLQPGMTLAIEPKFIRPGFGAIDLEDTWLVTRDGVELLHEQQDELFVVGN